MYLGRFTPQQHLQFEVSKCISSFRERSLSLGGPELWSVPFAELWLPRSGARRKRRWQIASRHPSAAFPAGGGPDTSCIVLSAPGDPLRWQGNTTFFLLTTCHLQLSFSLQLVTRTTFVLRFLDFASEAIIQVTPRPAAKIFSPSCLTESWKIEGRRRQGGSPPVWVLQGTLLANSWPWSWESSPVSNPITIFCWSYSNPRPQDTQNYELNT